MHIIHIPSCIHQPSHRYVPDASILLHPPPAELFIPTPNANYIVVAIPLPSLGLSDHPIMPHHYHSRNQSSYYYIRYFHSKQAPNNFKFIMADYSN